MTSKKSLCVPLVALVFSLLSGCSRSEAPRVLEGAARELHPNDVPRPHIDLPVPSFPGALPGGEENAAQALTSLENGSLEDKLVKKAACYALRRAQNESGVDEPWRARIYAELPALEGYDALNQYLIDKAVNRVAAGLAGLDSNYGTFYFNVCRF
jgi:hypothetical protein